MFLGVDREFPVGEEMGKELHPRRNNRLIIKDFFLDNGGEKGIRTLDTVSRIHAFQACAFNHSATSPAPLQYNGKGYEFKQKIQNKREKIFSQFY